MHNDWLLGLAGGGLIGLASALLLIAHGRIAGVSGIVGGLLPPTSADRSWRVAFLVGLGVAGAAAAFVAPAAIGPSARALPLVVAAGVLVGFGTRLGNGCTSGHGVCGLARMSGRSLAAVMTFISTGAVTAWIAGAS